MSNEWVALDVLWMHVQIKRSVHDQYQSEHESCWYVGLGELVPKSKLPPNY